MSSGMLEILEEVSVHGAPVGSPLHDALLKELAGLRLNRKLYLRAQIVSMREQSTYLTHKKNRTKTETEALTRVEKDLSINNLKLLSLGDYLETEVVICFFLKMRKFLGLDTQTKKK